MIVLFLGIPFIIFMFLVYPPMVIYVFFLFFLYWVLARRAERQSNGRK